MTAKDRAKGVARPVLQPLLARLRALAEGQERLDTSWAELHHLVLHLNHVVIDVNQRQTAIEEQLPYVLNAISTQNAMARELRRTETALREEGAITVADFARQLSTIHKRLAEIEARGEFIRREVMLEVRHDAARTAAPSPRVLRPDRVEAMTGHLHVNLGCGHVSLPDHVNVDQRELPGVDVVADVGNLPFERGSVERFHAAHLLEHFPRDELVLRLLPYWCELLAPGGELVAIVPDTEAMLEEYAAGTRTFDDLAMVVMGGQEYGGDFHFAMFSRSSLEDALRSTGFEDVTIRAAGRANGLCLEMEVTGRRPVTT